MLTYLVLGGNGQLGQALRKVAPSNVSLIYPKERVDITNFEAVRNAILEDYVDGVINCAAYTAVDKAEHDFATA
ncbi:sugar nucleotide-binding protein, partial [Escherichia coli]|nr:sugar nucleotide-binding protein [Escherichia coli]